MDSEWLTFIVAASRAVWEIIHKMRSRSEEEYKNFVDHYLKHSKRQIDAVSNWINEMRFVSCSYEYGRLEIYPASNIPIPHRAKAHLEIAYPQIIEEYNRIKDSREQLCDEINAIMINESYPQTTLSFHGLIRDKIRSSCPTLKKSNDYELQTNNVYFDTLIFARIFCIISNNRSTINLTIMASDMPNTEQLWFEKGTQGLAQGSPQDMRKLKVVLENLVNDEDVVRLVKQYNELRKHLTDIADVERLRQMINELHDYIYEDQALGGLDACDSCRPATLPPVIRS